MDHFFEPILDNSPCPPGTDAAHTGIATKAGPVLVNAFGTAPDGELLTAALEAFGVLDDLPEPSSVAELTGELYVAVCHGLAFFHLPPSGLKDKIRTSLQLTLPHRHLNLFTYIK